MQERSVSQTDCSKAAYETETLDLAPQLYITE